MKWRRDVIELGLKLGFISHPPVPFSASIVEVAACSCVCHVVDGGGGRRGSLSSYRRSSLELGCFMGLLILQTDV